MDKRLDRWLLEMPNIARGLARLLVECDCLRIDRSKSVDNDLITILGVNYKAYFAFNALNRIDDNCDSTLR